MDLSPIVNQVYGYLWYIIPAMILSSAIGFTLRSAWAKGVFGEFVVNALTTTLLPKGEYHLIKDITLPVFNGTTQIDQVLVSKYGVFVIETKNYSGTIYGSAKKKVWTRWRFGKSNTFQNPLHQNFKHTKALELALNIHRDKIHSVIVFIGGAKIKGDMPSNVTRALGVIKYIKSKDEKIMSQREVDKVIKDIGMIRLKRGFQTNKRHRKNLRKNFKEE